MTTVDEICVPCGHPRSAHHHDDEFAAATDGLGTYCAGDLGCWCHQFLSQADIDKADAAYKPCSRCGGDPYYCPCTTGWSSTGGMRW